MNKATRRRYTAEFKAEAVALVQDQGYKIADAARALGIDRKLLDRWMAKAREQPQPSAAADSRDAELAKLREEVRKLRIEKEILKNLRAAATASVPSCAETPVRGCIEPPGSRTCSGRKQRPSAHWWFDPVKKHGPGIAADPALVTRLGDPV
jgi:transposase